MDLGDMLVFASFIAIICLRPDIVLFSTSIKTHHLGINLIFARKIWRSGTERNFARCNVFFNFRF